MQLTVRPRPCLDPGRHRTAMHGGGHPKQGIRVVTLTLRALVRASAPRTFAGEGVGWASWSYSVRPAVDRCPTVAYPADGRPGSGENVSEPIRLIWVPSGKQAAGIIHRQGAARCR